MCDTVAMCQRAARRIKFIILRYLKGVGLQLGE
jgi:hypothetical protein